jgi:hypothetical protein
MHDSSPAALLLARMRSVAAAPEVAAEAHALVSGGYMAAMDSHAVAAYRESGALHAFALAWSPEEYRRRGPSAEDYCTDVTAVKMWHADVSGAATGREVIQVTSRPTLNQRYTDRRWTDDRPETLERIE